MYTKSRNDKGISDSNIAFALSVKNIICDVERTTTKKLLTAAILFPLINIVGIAKPNRDHRHTYVFNNRSIICNNQREYR